MNKKDNNKNNSENFSKVSINWYPGHMAKTKKQIIQDLKLIDIVIELLDARIPISSQNPNIAEITKNKKKIIVLNKCDLADENQNKKWIEYFDNKNIPVVLVDSNSGKGIEAFIKKVEQIMKLDLEIHSEKGRVGRKIRAMILGIPNVGKSSFINRISKKTSAGVGNRPGITRQKQWIRINEKIELLDTPGVLWPKFESEILDKIEIAYQLTKFLLENYKKKLCERYKLDEEYVNNILEREQPENENIYEIFLNIGKNRGCIMSGGRIDEEKTARILLDEFKNGKLGKITIEKPF